MPFRRRLRSRIELWGFKLAGRLIPLMSRRAVVRLARIGGALAYVFARRDRRIALANIALAFGSALSVAERRRLVRRSFSTFALTGLDYFWFSRNRQERLSKWIVMHGDNWPWMAGKPVIAVTAHYGNWEVLGWLMIMHGSMIASVAKPVKNPLIDAEVNRIRTQSGAQIIPREGALRSLVRILKAGNSVALLLDQDTLPAEGGVFVPFFGVPVPISSAAAGLSLKLKIPVAMAFCTCDDQGVYHGHCREWLVPDAMGGVTTEEYTARIAATIEDVIRKEPGYWLWSYKRWKRRLPDVDPALYPYYADC